MFSIRSGFLDVDQDTVRPGNQSENARHVLSTGLQYIRGTDYDINNVKSPLCPLSLSSDTQYSLNYVISTWQPMYTYIHIYTYIPK